MAPPLRSTLRQVHALVARRTGMALSELQCRRLDEKLAARPGGLSAQFLLHLQAPSGAAQLAELIDVIAVQKTELFRDESQLAALRMHVLEPLVARMRRPLRLWSAGCATGEEVATLLVLLAEIGADPQSTVLGTDISETAIARARELCFTSEQLQRVHPMLRDRWFMPVGVGRFTLAGPLKERAHFLCHNLMDTQYPTAAEGQGFDIIICRNVLIYFSPEAFEQVVSSLAGRLTPEGILMLSAAEPLLRAPPSLRTVRCDQAFFYARAPEAVVKTPSFTGLPAVGAAPDEGPPGETGPHSEADALFAQVLERAAGSEASTQTAETLWRCLSLDPDLAAARYLLGMLLEQRGTLAEAAAEYRRALRSLEEGRARATPFFLNNARLQVACARAVERVERAAGSSTPR